jgi:hypothetical protein
MTVEIFNANRAATTVSSGGTDAPAAGTSESWTVASSAGFPVPSSGASPPTQFHVCDPAAPAEMIAVVNVSGTAWTVTRGAESTGTGSTTPVAHAPGFTVQQVMTTGFLGSVLQKSGGAMQGPLAPAVSVLTDAATVTLNALAGNDFTLALTSAVGSTRAVAAPAALADGQNIAILLIQPSSGGPCAVTWSGAWDFGSAGAPALSTAPSLADLGSGCSWAPEAVTDYPVHPVGRP